MSRLWESVSITDVILGKNVTRLLKIDHWWLKFYRFLQSHFLLNLVMKLLLKLAEKQQILIVIA